MPGKGLISGPQLLEVPLRFGVVGAYVGVYGPGPPPEGAEQLRRRGARGNAEQ